MRIKGKRTVVDHVDVEIDAKEFLMLIYQKSLPRGLSHLSDDGYWYRVCGKDYHRNEELYEKDRPATEQEIELKKAYRILREHLSETKL
jgi:hypothetical protein